MSDPPPTKRLRQSKIFDAFKKKTNQVKDSTLRESSRTTHTKTEEKEDVPGKMFGGHDSVPNVQDSREVDRSKIAEAAESRLTRSTNRTSPKNSNVTENEQENTVNVSTSEPSTSTAHCEVLRDSQGSITGSSQPEPEENSPLLFDSDIEDVPDSLTPSANKDVNASGCLGTPVSSLNVSPDCLHDMGSLAATQHHTVLIKLPYHVNEKPVPHPKTYIDKWDGDHVRMPCSSENLYPVETNNGSKALRSRWDVIQTALLSDISTSLDLEEAILSFNSRYAQKWDFNGLHSFFTEVVEAEEAKAFFSHTLPKMIRLALELPQLCTKPIPMLKKGANKSITMSQHQAASLLANAFFCTYPRRNTYKKGSEYSSYPDINFNSLFQGGKHPKAHRKAEKLKCIINYFRRVTSKMPEGTLTFHRQCIKDFPEWGASSSHLTRLHVSATGTIEVDGAGMLQVDFANKFLGGGVLGYGCVQEEIRFLICPELILSRLFTEVLDRNECLVMTGSETFSTYSGYADSFKWSGNFVDTTPRDPWGRKCTEIVAIDALVFRTHADQFHENLVKRELNKAYCGFLKPGIGPVHLPAIASGNWGCGAFGGDLRLKSLLQLMACAEARRDMCYFTFRDYELMNDLHQIHKFITEKKLTIADIFNLIRQYYDNICLRTARSRRPKMDLYEYIYNVYCAADTDSDTDTYPNSEQAEPETSQEVLWESRNSPDYAANTP